MSPFCPQLPTMWDLQHTPLFRGDHNLGGFSNIEVALVHFLLILNYCFISSLVHFLLIPAFWFHYRYNGFVSSKVNMDYGSQIS